MAGFFDIIGAPPVAWESEEGYPLFNRVSIETSSYCNRSCSFCPVSTGRRDFGQKLMPEVVWCAVRDELASYGFDGVAQMFLLNEPTLDKTLKTKCRELRLACPRVTMYVSTNADVIKEPAQLDDLFDAGINCVNLNIYDPGQEQHDRIWALAQNFDQTTHKYRRHGPRKRLVCVTDMRPERLTASSTDSFYDRTAEDRREGVPQVHCARPHRHIVVLWDGRVPLCCALDPTALEDELILGQVPDRTLWEMWNCETMYRYRWHLQQARRDLPGCSTCTHRMAYSHVVRRVTASEEVLKTW